MNITKSAAVRKRRHGYKDEAVKYAQKVYEENQKLRKTLKEGEGVLVEQAKNRVQAQLDKAKAAYKEAYETGDPDKLIEAQEQLTALQNEKFRVESYKPQPQEKEVQVQAPPSTSRSQSQMPRRRHGPRRTSGLEMTLK